MDLDEINTKDKVLGPRACRIPLNATSNVHVVVKSSKGASTKPEAEATVSAFYTQKCGFMCALYIYICLSSVPRWRQSHGSMKNVSFPSQNWSFIFRTVAKTSASEVSAGSFSAARTAFGRTKGFVCRSSPIVVGTVGNPRSRKLAISASRAASALFVAPFSTVRAKAAFAAVYS